MAMQAITQLDELIGLYVLKRFGGKREALQKDRRSALRPLVDYFGAGRQLDTLTVADVRGWIEWQQAKRGKRRGSILLDELLSPYTVNKRVRMARALFNWAVLHDLMTNSPMVGIKTPRTPQKLPAAIDQSDVEKLLAGLRHKSEWLYKRDVALIYCLRDTGARIGGLCGAKLTDLELERRQLLVTEKGEQSRTVYLSPATVEKLRLYLAERKEFWGRRCSDALFIAQHGGALKYAGAQQILERAAQRGGVEGRHSAHSFRHAFARDMLRDGADLATVSQIMGHSGIQVTAQYYARWSDTELRIAHQLHTPARMMKGGEK
jgi:site-specific recombinase XerD